MARQQFPLIRVLLQWAPGDARGPLSSAVQPNDPGRAQQADHLQTAIRCYFAEGRLRTFGGRCALTICRRAVRLASKGRLRLSRFPRTLVNLPALMKQAL